MSPDPPEARPAEPLPPAPERPTPLSTGEARRIVAGKALKRTAGVVIFLLVFNNLVLPQLGGARKAVNLLSEVNPLLLVLALGLELSAFVAYTMLTRATLPRDAPIRTLTLLRIQLATKAVTNLVPGGSAAGGALGFRLLTKAGVEASAAGFTLATVGLGSAVVLNLLLWLALLVSIPVNGFDPKYGAAALIGFVLLSGFAGLVVLLRHGSRGAERVIRAIVRPLPFVKEDAAARVVRQVAGRVGELLDDPALLRRGVGWAVAFWLLDASSLYVFIRAFGSSVGPLELIVAFGLAQVLGAIPITPGGLGVIELALTSALVGFGLNRGTAAIAVTSYRLAAFWLPIPLGAIAYGTLKVGPGSLRRIRQRRPIRTLAEDAAAVAHNVREWDVDQTP